MKMKNVQQHQFSQIPEANIPRSVFNRSHAHKTTFDAGYLVPFFIDEVLPGDTFNVRATLFARLATPIAPIMDNMTLDVFYFFCPLRLLWTNFAQFMGERIDPEIEPDFITPCVNFPVGGFAAESLWDYFGLPVGISPSDPGARGPLAFYSRAYNLIWNEWFRDENIQDLVTVDKDDGPDDPADYVLLRRCKRHDYFTSCLPWPQKGPGVELPLGEFAPVIGIGKATLNPTDTDVSVYETGHTASSVFHKSSDIGSGVSVDSGWYGKVNPSTGYPEIFADLSSATAATINSLRTAFQLQRMYERDARGGTRYTEIVRAHFGVISPDARLQRPEYLGGSSAPVNIVPVQQTSGTGATGTPQGNLAAFGTVINSNNGFTKSFTEHGVIIGLMCVRADLTYQQGINRAFSRPFRWDYYWPGLAHLGEQGVYNWEIFYTGVDVDDDKIFGYQERYAEYRYYPSKITGKLRSSYAQSLDFWHLSQEFADTPTLSPEFIEENPPVDRVIAVPSEPHFIFDSHIDMKCARPMPVYSVPGMIDHF